MMRAERERQYGAGVTSATVPAGDIQVLDERAHDKEAPAGIAHEILRQARVVREAGSAIERVQDRYLAADVERKLGLVATVAHDVAEQFAEDQLGEARIGVGRSSGPERGDHFVAGVPRGTLVAYRKSPTGVALRRPGRARYRDGCAFDANRQDRDVVHDFLQHAIAYRGGGIVGIPHVVAS